MESVVCSTKSGPEVPKGPIQYLKRYTQLSWDIVCLERVGVEQGEETTLRDESGMLFNLSHLDSLEII